MRWIICVLLCAVGLQFQKLAAQASFWTEDFDAIVCSSGCVANPYAGVNGNWTVTSIGAQAAFANQWYVSCAEEGVAAGFCGQGCVTGDNSLHVGNVAGSPGGLCPTGDCGAAYDASNTVTTNRRVESPLIDCSAQTSLTLSFNYIAAGTPGVDYCDVVISLDGGTTWAILPGGANLTAGCCCLLPGFCGAPDPISCTNIFSGQGFWTNLSLPLPAGAELNPNVKIGFHWRNNSDNLGTDPSIAVDDIVLSGLTVLPVELDHFTAEASPQGHVLEWQAPDWALSHVRVERSADGRHFEALAEVPGNAIAGTQARGLSTYLDASPYPGANFYRLALVDPNGKVTLSTTRLLQGAMRPLQVRALYPQPLQGAAALQLELESAASGPLDIRVLDLRGREVLREQTHLDQGLNQLSLSLPALAEGIYLLRLHGAGTVLSHRFVVTR